MPAHAGGTRNVRRYQRRLSGPTVLPTPESDDSGAKGTRMAPSYEAPGPAASFGRMAYCQSPFRLSHADRTSCGRGYSGRGFAGDTSRANLESSLPSTGFQPVA